MKRRFVALVVSLPLAVVALAGCSTKTWYEAMKFNAQNDCRRQPPGESESCLGRVNTMSYEDYERSRAGKNQ